MTTSTKFTVAVASLAPIRPDRKPSASSHELVNLPLVLRNVFLQEDDSLGNGSWVVMAPKSNTVCCGDSCPRFTVFCTDLFVKVLATFFPFIHSLSYILSFFWTYTNYIGARASISIV
jgi:hypothetical protein